jgi:hypothetical protein
LIYTFDFRGVRFIFLWSGKYDYRSTSLWDGDRPKYEEQMKQMGQWIDDAKAKGIRKVFISFPRCTGTARPRQLRWERSW